MLFGFLFGDDVDNIELVTSLLNMYYCLRDI